MSYKMKNALTFDVEEWFHVSSFESRIKMTEWDNFESRAEDNVKVVLDILSERDIKATFFVLGHLAERKPALVKNIHRKGHEVATHGYSHKLIYTQSRNEFAEEDAQLLKERGWLVSDSRLLRNTQDYQLIFCRTLQEAKSMDIEQHLFQS